MRPHLIPFRRPAALDSLTSAREPSYTFVDIKKGSRWFDQLLVAGLPPGQRETSCFPDDGSETFYIFSRGGGELVLPDGIVNTIRQFDGVYFGSGSGAELRAGNEGLEWLAVSTNGGKPTPHAKGSMEQVLARSGANAGKAPIAFDRRWVAPRQWPASRSAQPPSHGGFTR